MAGAPPKPWERLTQPNVNHRQPHYQPDHHANLFMSGSPVLVPGNGGGGSNSLAGTGSAPPLPPRPAPTMTPYTTYPRPAYSGYGSMGMYGSSMYGGAYRPFGQYGMTGYHEGSNENGFLQVAENSSRQAFESIESIVHAFGSVSMMLESTYHAVYSTFRAVLGVADHFNRMKSHFAQIFSALAVVRTLRWLYNRLLYILGLRSRDPSLEAVWQRAGSSVSGAPQITEADIKASKSSWPIVMFLGVVFGGPYLIWRLLSSLVPTKPKTQSWVLGQGEHYVAVGQYPFQAKMRNELSFTAGQQLVLAPKDQQPSVQGWLLASSGKNVGLVPSTYIKILGQRSSQPQQTHSQQKHQGPGNPVVASRIPGVPSPQLTRQPFPQHPAPPFMPGLPSPTHQSLSTSSQHRPPPPTAWHRPPPTTQHHQHHQGAPPLTTQHHQQQGAPPLTTQHQQHHQGAPPLTTQHQGAPPLTTQHQGAPPLTTQHHHHHHHQEAPPLTTQQHQQQQEAPPLTTQGQSTSPQTEAPKSSPSPTPLHQEGVAVSRPSAPLASLDPPPLTPQGNNLNGSRGTTAHREGESFNMDEWDSTSEAGGS